MLTTYLAVLLGRLARCYWVGLAEEARPRLEQLIQWMGWHDPDEFECRPDLPGVEVAVWDTRQSWWETLGLAKWLARDVSATGELAQAVVAHWDKWQALRPDRHACQLASRGASLSHILALALAANRPEIGAHLCGLVDDCEPSDRDNLKVGYGRWACVHLSHGGTRDRDFVRSGSDVLLENSADRSRLGPSSERLLWLKAIWFDSGMAGSAEEAVLREYEVIDGLQRPNFLRPRESFP